MTLRSRYRQPLSAILLLSMAVSLSGCGLVTLPFRVTGAVVKIVPVAGHAAAAPLEGTAAAIDPGL